MSHTILIVDDEEQVRRVLRTKLERCGYTVHEAANGEQAIRALAKVAVDLVITDILMPEKDGIETILFLRKQRPKVKVIAISAPHNRPYLQDARGLGAARTFQKPLRLSDLADAVQELLATAVA